MKRIKILILLMAIFQVAFGQEKSPEINKLWTEAIAKKLKAEEMVLGKQYATFDNVLIKIKRSNKWGIYSLYGLNYLNSDIGNIKHLEFEELVPPEFDSLNFFNENDKFQIVKNKNKYGILRNLDFTEISTVKTNCKYEELLHKRIEGTDYILFREDGKWGLIDWLYEYVIVDPTFINPNNVPLISFEPWQLRSFVKLKAKEVILGYYLDTDAVLAKIKRSKKWGIYTTDWGLNDMDIEKLQDVEFQELVPPQFDSLNFLNRNDKFQIVKNNNKYGIIRNTYYTEDKKNEIGKCKYEALIHKRVEDEDYILFREDGKWGLIDWIDEYVLVDPIFVNPDEVSLISMESWQKESFKKLKRKLSADLVIFDYINGDGVFKARNKKTKKWGMYQGYRSELIEVIPSHYDSLRFFSFNGRFTAVYNEGKVGFYLAYWSYEKDAKQTIECKYEDYKRYTANKVPVLAVKKDGKWGWVDWLTGEEKSEFIYDTHEELPYPTYKQNTYFEESIEEEDLN